MQNYHIFQKDASEVRQFCIKPLICKLNNIITKKIDKPHGVYMHVPAHHI